MIPTAERHWRALRRLDGLDAYLVEAESYVDAYWTQLRGAGMPPASIAEYRQAVPWPMLPLTALGLEPQYRHLDNAAPNHAELSTRVAAWLTWRDMGKRIYRLTPELVEGLQGAKWPASFPAEHFRPPVGSVALELPTPTGVEHVLWVLTVMPPARSTLDGILRPELSGVVYHAICYHYQTDHGRIGYMMLDLSEPTLNGALDAARESAEHVARVENPALHARINWPMWSGTGIVNLATNALLYILGNDDIVEQVEYVERPKRRAKGPLSPKEQRAVDLAEPRVLTAGVRYAAAIERHTREVMERMAQEADGEPTRSITPHMRTAHAHLYWTGVGRTIPVVKYLPPIPVLGGPTPSRADDAVPVIRPVR